MQRRRLLSVLWFALIATSLAVQAQTALQFVPVAPCRVADTRNPAGQFGGPTMTRGSQRDFPVPQSACNIPNTAAAYSLNVTVVPWGTLDYLTIWPTGQTRPVLSTLNSRDGRTKANAAVVPAGTGGAISVYVTDKTDVILDIDGYFAPATGTTLAFFPLTPCRVVDTRGVPGPLGGPSLKGGKERDFPILSSSCTVPNSAQGYSLNFTVVPKTTLHFLTVWPTGQTKPWVSTLNAPTGTIVANAAIVPAGLTGAISVYVTDDTDLIADIDGYFALANSGPNALSLYTLLPCRVLDTRNTSGAFSGTLPVDVLGSGCSVPGAQAYIFNGTVVPQSGAPLGYLTLWPDAEGQPYVSTLNAIDGATTSNMAIVPTLNGDIDAYATSSTQLIMDIFSYFAPILPLNINSLSLPSGTLTYSYSTTLGAAGGVLPYNWAITSGSLPAGLNLDPGTGVISGIPTSAGNYPFTVQVTDSQSPPAHASAQLSISIDTTITQLSITTTSLPSGSQNNNYSAMLAATGGITPYTWSIISGSLPTGLSLNSSTGAIAGTPSGAGVLNFTVKVTDAQSPAATATKALSISINPAVPLSIATTSLPNGTAGTVYSATVMAIGGVYPYNWSITAGELPDGLTLNSSTGAITGTPTVVGTSNFTVKVIDSETPAVSATTQLSITINSAPLRITTTSLPNGIAGQAYSATLTATGGTMPYTWSLTAGKLPDGLTLNSSTGAITGTPENVGSSNLSFQVTDSEAPPVKASAQLSLTITSPGGSGDPGVLKGNYVLYLNGFSSAGQWTLAGSLISDGLGNITSAMVDANSVASAPYSVALSGTYFISSTGLNTITLQGQGWGPVTFAFVLNSIGNGKIIEYDDTTGQGSRASGMLRKADPSAFSLSKLNGSYVFGMTGGDPSANRFVDVGVFTLASGNITNGACDVNGFGGYSTCTFFGSLSTINAQTGRGVSTIQNSFGDIRHEVVYVVSAGEMVMEQIDATPGTGIPVAVGKVLQQSGLFSNASLNGYTVSYMQDIHGGDGLDQSIAAIFSFDGNGNNNTIAMDEDLAGTIKQDQTSQGTYSVQSNGALDFGTGNPAGFLVSQNKGFFVGRGNSTIFGTLEPQTGPPFSNASIAGTYAGGSLAPLDYANGRTEVNVISADGLGTLTMSGDVDNPGDGLDQWFGALANYNIAASGRGTVPGDTTVIYVISPAKWLVLQPKPGAGLNVYEH